MSSRTAVAGPDAEDGGPVRAAVASTPAQRERRKRIVAAATELLTELPYDSIQIRDVAARAEVALGTLYRYFPSKEQLFAVVMLEWSSSTETALASPGHARVAEDQERLRILLRRTVRAFERHPNFVQVISVLGAATDPVVNEALGAYSDEFASAIAEAVPDVADDDVAVLVTLSNSLLDSLLRTWWLGRLPIRAVEDHVDRAVAVMFHGVARR